ncbi:hypothetical protein B0T22DRAFT_447673 [Podospora appendiculata]|uniref:Secreted protein n=1 Tax=Podospora appendiculata TaxID=314037 RepID=A0AAE1CFL7_9PEZI|nr:hypothetical protein B0T22DRAFT_447673 [Podospora appendiculata]
MFSWAVWWVFCAPYQPCYAGSVLANCFRNRLHEQAIFPCLSFSFSFLWTMYPLGARIRKSLTRRAGFSKIVHLPPAAWPCSSPSSPPCT